MCWEQKAGGQESAETAGVSNARGRPELALSEGQDKGMESQKRESAKAASAGNAQGLVALTGRDKGMNNSALSSSRLNKSMVEEKHPLRPLIK